MSDATGKIKRYSDPVTGPVWPRGWVEVDRGTRRR